MNWKLRALTQSLIATLPDSVSEGLYYRVQRRFGRLRNPNFTALLEDSVEFWRRIRRVGASGVDATFLEVGTGRTPTVPIGFYLMGAERTVTFDLNRYLQPELLRGCVEFLRSDEEGVNRVFGSLLLPERLDSLLSHAGGTSGPLGEDFLRHLGIEYVAPGDASRTSLDAESVDFHLSRAVFEHIPPDALHAVLKEAHRLVRPGGLLVHLIDYTDHFAHMDHTISPKNFCRFSERQWKIIAGNRFMYQNRLQHDDYLELFADAGLEVIDVEVESDEPTREALADGQVVLRPRFQDKPLEILALMNGWITARRP